MKSATGKLMVMLFIMVCQLLFLITQNRALESIFTYPVPQYHCRYREYPDPQHHSGLPFLGDVFAADQGTFVYFVTVNKGGCRKEWEFAQEFHTIKKDEPHFFLCSFPDGTITVSDITHRKGARDFLWSNAVIIIRCPIPPQYQHLVQKPRAVTTLTVSLHATEDLESKTKTTGLKSQSYRDIPVCHGEWPQPDNTIRPGPKKPYTLALTTRIATTYVANGFSNALVVTQEMLVAWIEYHMAIGVEQFYIFDHDEEEHGILEQWLMYYIQREIVTYVWFPFHDCERDYDVAADRYLGQKGSQWRIGQYVVTNAALRRYAHQTKWLGHWDIDEYLILPKNFKVLPELLHHEDKKTIDYFSFTEKWYSVCNGTKVNPHMLPTERAECYKNDTTPPKSIMKTSRILYFMVHHPYATMDGKSLHPSEVTQDKGFIAHYRRRPFHRYDAVGFSGIAKSNFTDFNSVLAEWTPYLKQQVNRQVKKKLL